MDGSMRDEEPAVTGGVLEKMRLTRAMSSWKAEESWRA